MQLADQLTEIVTDAVLAVRRPGEPIDLHMVERMHVRCLHQFFHAPRRRHALLSVFNPLHWDVPIVWME